MRRPRGGLVGKALDRIEEYTGYTVVDSEHLRVQEAVAREAYFLANEMGELGYVSMNYAAGRPTEPTATTRKRWAQQARVVWLADPLAGAAVELRNEFTFGRGVPKPRAKAKKVQKVIDAFWDDPQNQRVLTTFRAQMRFGNSLSVQSNVFFLMFDDGDDGKVKLSFLNHDFVQNAYTDPDNRQRVLFFIAAEPKDEWDFQTHAAKASTATPVIRYYEAWDALEDALAERGMSDEDAKKLLDRYRAAAAREHDKEDPDDPTTEQQIQRDQPFETPVGLTLPPPARLGEGKVYHVAENLDMEMVFGVPRMRRTIRWYTAFNEFMAARVDMMQAAASFIMKKTVKGATTPGQIEKLAARGMRAVSDLRTVAEEAVDPSGATKLGPKPASIAGESGNLTLEPFKLDSGSANAQQDGQMLRAQVSAGDRWPQHYLGDVGSANLATATSMELPALKHVEAFQELSEGVFRWGLDRAIDRAVEVGQLDPNAPDEEDEQEELARVTSLDVNPEVEESPVVETRLVECVWRINRKDVSRPTQVTLREDGSISYDLAEAHEDKNVDEAQTGLDLGYEFAMPSPLRRLMGDLVTAAATVAQFADPNGENTELTRTLVAFVFSEAFEMQDAPDVVDRIFPKGYEPLSVQAMRQQMQPTDQGVRAGSPDGRNFFGPEADGQPTDPTEAHQYGTKTSGTLPEQMVSEAAETMNDEWEVAPLITTGRAGQPVVFPGRRRSGARGPIRANGRVVTATTDFDREMRKVTMDALADADMERLVPTNGKE